MKKLVVNPATWALTIDGLVQRVQVLTMQALNDFPQYSIALYAACNHHAPIQNTVQRWSGVLLQTLLTQADVLPDATQLRFYALDGYRVVLPLKAVADDMLLALTLNDVMLSADEGFPTRVIHPQMSLHQQPRWLTRIEVITAALSTDIEILKTQVYFDDVDAVLCGREIVLGGVAVSSQAIVGVELRLDGGAWIPAALYPETQKQNGVRWRFGWRFEYAGQYRLEARAMLADGQHVQATHDYPAVVLNVVEPNSLTR